MRNVFRKITISLLALSIVFTSVVSYKFQSNDYIQAEALDLAELRNKAMQLLAVIVASVGLKITNDVDLNSMESLYQQLSPSAKTVIDNFDYTNKYSNGYYGLHVGQYQEIAHSLIDTLSLWTVEAGTTLFATLEGISRIPSVNLNPYLTNTGTAYSMDKYRIFGLSPTYYIYPNLTYTVPTNFIYNQRFIVNNATYINSSFSVVPLRYISTTTQIEYSTGNTISLDDLVVSIRIDTNGTVTDKSKIDNYYYFPIMTGAGYSSVWNYLSLKSFVPSIVYQGLQMLYDGTLTLPAPPGGWADSEPGDIDVPSSLQRALDFFGLPLVVLGGLTLQDLEDLKNKGPNDVTVGDLPEEVVDDFARDTTDTTVDIPDSGTITDTTGLAGWLGGALGALGGALTGALGALGNALTGLLNGILGVLNSILTAILGLATAIGAVIASIFAPLFEWLGEISTNWDWLKNILNWIKDFFQFLWEIIKFLMNLFRYLFNYFILLLDLLYTLFFSGLLSVLVGLSSRIKTLFSVFPSPLDMIANMTYDIAIFGLILAIVRNVLFMFRSKK